MRAATSGHANVPQRQLLIIYWGDMTDHDAADRQPKKQGSYLPRPSIIVPSKSAAVRDVTPCITFVIIIYFHCGRASIVSLGLPPAVFQSCFWTIQAIIYYETLLEAAA